MDVEEKIYPRGGTTEHRTSNGRLSFGVLQNRHTKKYEKKNKKKLNLSTIDKDDDPSLEITSADLITSNTIEEGMLIMGIVSHIEQMRFFVSLPGRLQAQVNAIDISDSYTKTIESVVERSGDEYAPLSEIIEEGDLVYGRVITVKGSMNGPSHHIKLSIKPSSTHADLNHMHIQIGFIFNGAIQEIQDHGYIIESGIKFLRCFLPKENVSKHRLSKLRVGQLVHLKVTKVFTDSTASNCTCQLLEPYEMIIKSLKDPKLDYLMPSTLVKFRITKILKDGLQGTIMNGTFPAYVNEHNLVTSLSWLNEYQIDEIYQGYILYVMPLTKLVYISLNKDLTSKKESKENRNDTKEGLLKSGDIIEEAIVHHMGSGGVILILNKKFKGFLSYRGIKYGYKGNFDQADLPIKYAPNTKHTVRIIQYNIIDKMYICTDNVKLVNETIFSIDDIKPGEFVTAQVVEYNMKIGGYILKLGRLKGILERYYLQPQPLKMQSSALEKNAQVKCRVVDINKERRTIYLTNRTEFMAKDCELLLSLEDAKINSNYMGTVMKVTNSEIPGNSFALVKFFNNIKGILYERRVGDNYKNILEGHTMLFSVLEKQEEKVIVGLASNYSFEVGRIYEAKVLSRLENGLEVEVSTQKGCDLNGTKKTGHMVKVMLPMRLLSDYCDLWQAKLQVYSPGQKISVMGLPDNVLSLRDAKYFEQDLMPNWKNLKVGDIIRTSIKNVDDNIIEVMASISGYGKSLKIHSEMLLMNMKTMKNISLQLEQILYAKVLGKDLGTKTLTVSAKFLDVCKGVIDECGQHCHSYIKEVDEIRKEFLNKKRPIADFTIGDVVTAYFQCVNNITHDWEYSVENKSVLGIVKNSLKNNIEPPPVGTLTQCLILWVDYNENILYLSNKASDQSHVVSTRTHPLLPETLRGKKGVAAKILYHGENIFICSLKKQICPLIYCPTRLLFNDIEKIASVSVQEGEFCKLNFIYDKLPIAVLDSIDRMWQNRKRKLIIDIGKPKRPKPTTTIEDDYKMAKKIIKCQSGDEMPEQNNGEAVIKLLKSPKREAEIRLKPMPGVDDFWTDPIITKNNCVESNEITFEDQEAAIVKRKLSAVEKFKLRREEENRLRTIEENNANPNQTPNSVHEFERLVLSEPYNSRNWITYMTYHTQDGEFEKARALARRALNIIPLCNSMERLNIWVCLLNLELNFGTEETFDNTFKEAVTVNDPFKIHVHTVDVLKAASKHKQLIELVNIMTKKFKSEPESWKIAANTYFAIGESQKAQSLLKKSLNSLPERQHTNMIVSFALMNNQYGNCEMAQTLMDELITSCPRRVDIWSQYVDMLVKSKLIDSARNVLRRATIQELPLKKMRVIFNKYIEFEERFGTLDSVNNIKAQAQSYVNKNRVSRIS